LERIVTRIPSNSASAVLADIGHSLAFSLGFTVQVSCAFVELRACSIGTQRLPRLRARVL
jgi:hypothetical protein